MAPPPVPMQAQAPDNDNGSSGDLRALDYNLVGLCDHIQNEGFNSGSFSDVVVQAMGSSYCLHRLILSRSPYFRNMLHGPWKEADAPTLILHIDDTNVNSEAIAIALAHLYGHQPKLNDNNAFRVLAAASFLDLQDLCAICTNFVISELWTSNFLAYQVFAESQDYGIHGDRIRNACWGYLCQSGTVELREVLPKLSCQTLHALLISDDLWVPNEEKRFELALYALLAKAALTEPENPQEGKLSSEIIRNVSDSSVFEGKTLISSDRDDQLIETDFQCMGIENDLEGYKAAQNIPAGLADCVADCHADISYSKSEQVRRMPCAQPMLDSRYSLKMEQPDTLKSLADSNKTRASCSHAGMQNDTRVAGKASSETTAGPSREGSCYHNIWIDREESRKLSSVSSILEVMPNDWRRCSMLPSWGGRVVGKRQVKNAKEKFGTSSEEYNAFSNIFEGGSLLYCNIPFEALLNVRKQLEEMGFPCKAVNDGLWLQMLLSQRVQEIGADTCKNCCLTSIACTCRHPYGYSNGGAPMAYYRTEQDKNSATGSMGNVYINDTQGEGNGLYRPVRVHVRGPIDGLAGLGRGTTFVSAAASLPARYVFSRVPYGPGNRNCQQSLANGESDVRIDFNGDLSGDGLTALFGLSQGSNVGYVHSEQFERVYEPDAQSRSAGAAVLPSASGGPLQMLETQEHALGLEWENSEDSSISLDLKTPLHHLPPFRFGVEFEDVHRLTDGQVKHSQEVFYAGSLWKISVQAFSDEDPQGRRTLGLFLHRRKADATDYLRKVHMYVDSREKVTVRYQLICPSKREVMVFGSFKQAGTLLPKAPKGWGWRTALLFDELADLLQGGSLRAAAVVQLV